MDLKFFALAAFGVSVTPALAASEGTAVDRLRSLEQQIEAQQRQIDAQQRQIEAERAEIDALKAKLQAESQASAAAVETPKSIDTTVRAEPQIEARRTYEEGRPTLSSPDGAYSLSLTARIQFDLGLYFQDEAGPLSTDWRRGSVGGGRENIAATDLSSGKNFRRAQLGISGRLAQNFTYKIMPEFGGSGTEENPRLN